MQTTQAARLTFHPGLEGLRGVAVILVLLFHGGFEWARGGFLGVSTFFTLSGFLITGLLVTEHERIGRIRLPAFWGRRFRRLMPAALLGLLGIAAFAVVVADPVQRMNLRGEGLSALFYSANWWLIATGADYAEVMGSPSPVQHFWSLAIEEQYYLVYPPAVALILVGTAGSRLRLAVVLGLLSVVSLGWMAWLSETDASTARIYYGTDTRCGELLAGGLLALWSVGRRPCASGSARHAITALGVLGLMASGFYCATSSVDSPHLYAGGLAIYTASTLAIITAATQPAGPIAGLLSVSALRWAGRVSYGAYVYHWPIYLWLTPERMGLEAMPLVVLRIGVTFVLAGLSYRWLEEPIRSGRAVLEWRRWAAPAVAASAVAAAFVAVTPSVSSRPGADGPSRAASMPGDAATREPLRVLVVGDSVGKNIAEGLIAWGRTGARLQVLDATLKGCGLARGARVGEASRRKQRCDDWPQRIERLLREQGPDVVLVYTLGWDVVDRQLPGWSLPRTIGDPAFDGWLRSQLEESVGLLSANGAHVVWLSAVCVADRKRGRVGGVFDPDRVRRLNRDILAPLARAHPERMTYVDLFRRVCPGDRVAYDFEGMRDFRPDGIHFSPEGQRWIAEWLGPEILEIAGRAGRRLRSLP